MYGRNLFQTPVAWGLTLSLDTAAIRLALEPSQHCTVGKQDLETKYLDLILLHGPGHINHSLFGLGWRRSSTDRPDA